MARNYLQYGDHGPKVIKLQHLVNHNVFYRPKNRLLEDGEFGPRTAAAVQRTKYWMGYDKAHIAPIAGVRFFLYIRQQRPLDPAYKDRRDFRVKREQEVFSPQRELRLKALKYIKEELGTLERPNNSNHIKYNEWWGWGAVPYCVIGISWAWIKAGSTAFKRGERWAGTDLMLADAKAGNHDIRLTNSPDPGCPGVIDFDGKSDPDHALTFVKDNGDGTCQTIEFNTTGPSGIEGVFNKSRPLRNCWFFRVEK